MITFGAGVLVVTATQDAAGNAIALGSPIQVGILQEVNLSEEWEPKMLYGAQAFPVDVGRGKGKITLTAKFARINAELYNAALFGQPANMVTGYGNLFNDLTGQPIPGTLGGGNSTGIISPGGGTFNLDLGVQDVNGIPYTRVASATAGGTSGTYSVSGPTYSFVGADFGKTVFINYAYTNAASPVAAKKLTVGNVPMGYAPFFQVDLMAQKNGKTEYIRFPQVMCSKMSRTFKNDDYTIPDFTMEAFQDSLNNVSYRWLSE
jgi:hypothetical protein